MFTIEAQQHHRQKSLGVSGKGRINLNERKSPDQLSNPGPLAHHIGCTIWPGEKGRINVNVRKCPDQVSIPGPLALESDTIPAALYGLGISGKEKNQSQ